MTVDKVIAKIIWLTFLAHPVIFRLCEEVASTNNIGAYQDEMSSVLAI